MSVDFTALRTAIRDAAERAFAGVRQSHPEERFYAFALYTDDGAMTVEPAANSEESFDRKAGGEADPAMRSYYRWATGEWAYEAAGGGHFDAVYDLLNAPDRDGGDGEAGPAGDGGPEEFEEDEAFAAFKGHLIEAMTGALGDLDAVGFFGSGDERRKMALFVSISDSDEATQVENESARRLNPDPVYQQFLARSR